MKRPKHGATLKQYAYAKKLLNAEGRSKKDIALSVGFSPSVASNVEAKIEKSEGFQNAIIALASESNNLVMGIMAEYKARGFKEFTNKDLAGALSAISKAWERFNREGDPDRDKSPTGNKLKSIVLQRIENQTVNVTNKPVPVPSGAMPGGYGFLK